MVNRALGVVVYVLLLQYAYVTFTAPTFSYLGFTARDSVDLLAYGSAILLTIVIALVLPSRVRKPSDFMLWSFYVLAVAPTMTLSHYADIITVASAVWLTGAVGFLFLSAVFLVNIGPKFTLRIEGFPPRLAWGIIAAFSAATYAVLGATTGLQLRLVGLTDVQDVRFGYREMTASVGALGYLLTLQAYVINPLVMARGLYRRRWVLFGAGLLGQLLLYSAAGHKMSILSPVAILLIAFAYKFGPSLRGPSILHGVTAIALMSLAIDKVARTGGEMTLIFVQRLLLIPAGLVAAHIGIFEDQPKANFGDVAVIGAFADSPYQSTIAFVVGSVFTGNPKSSANANLFADGYANLGFTGMAIEMFVFVVLLWLLNASMGHLPMPVTASILALPALSLANTSAFTSILSQGIGLAILLGAILPSAGWLRESLHYSLGTDRGLQEGPRRRSPRRTLTGHL